MSFVWGAVAIGASGILNAVMSNNASNKAADAQRDAANQANQTQWDMYNQNREDLAPWRAAGTGALGQLTALTGPGGEFTKDFNMSNFVQDPGYQFRMDEGRKALERGASARGNLLGGATQKALTRYGQDYASGEYGNAYNRFMSNRGTRFNQLASLAGIGQTAQSQLGQFGTNTANQVSGNLMNLGGGQSAAYLSQGNALQGATNSLGNAWMQYSMRPQQSSGFSGYQNTTPWGSSLYGSPNGGTEYIPESNIPAGWE